MSLASLIVLGVILFFWAATRRPTQNQQFWEDFYLTGNFEDHDK